MKSRATNGPHSKARGSEGLALQFEPKLRADRNELALNELNEYEVREREWKQERYRGARLSGNTHFSCNRYEDLLADWKSCRTDANGLVRERVGLQLINHAKHCPQCAEFPMPLPLDIEDALG
jgi:hypothetical protein